MAVAEGVDQPLAERHWLHEGGEALGHVAGVLGVAEVLLEVEVPAGGRDVDEAGPGPVLAAQGGVEVASWPVVGSHIPIPC